MYKEINIGNKIVRLQSTNLVSSQIGISLSRTNEYVEPWKGQISWDDFIDNAYKIKVCLRKKSFNVILVSRHNLPPNTHNE